MLVEVYPYKNRTDRIKHYSDAGFYIRQNSGVLYVEAVDIYPNSYTYEETDIPVEEAPPEIGEQV